MLPLLKRDPNHFTLEKNGFQLITLEDNDLDLLDDSKDPVIDLCIKSCIKELEKTEGECEWEICILSNLRSGAFISRRRGELWGRGKDGDALVGLPFGSVHLILVQ